MASLPLTALYAGINGFTLVWLAILCVKARRAARVSLGDGGEKNLLTAIRAHGNNVEHMPMALIIIGLAEANGAAIWFIHGLGIILTVSRIIHPIGLYHKSTNGVNKYRIFGVLGTWITILCGAGYGILVGTGLLPS